MLNLNIKKSLSKAALKSQTYELFSFKHRSLEKHKLKRFLKETFKLDILKINSLLIKRGGVCFKKYTLYLKRDRFNLHF